jgi:hypothetical protein
MARMAFGLCNSPATYTRVINLVLRGLNWKVVLAFLDNILVLGKDFEGHLVNLRAVLVRFREYGLKLKPKKCELFQKEVEDQDIVQESQNHFPIQTPQHQVDDSRISGW